MLYLLIIKYFFLYDISSTNYVEQKKDTVDLYEFKARYYNTEPCIICLVIKSGDIKMVYKKNKTTL